jgi:hypothetical protein
VLNPPRPVIKQVESKPPARLLPYEQQLAKKPDQAAEPQSDSAPAAQPTQPTVPAETAKATTDTPASDKQAAVEKGAQPPGVNARSELGASQTDGAVVPPSEDSDANDGPAMAPDDGVGPSEQGAIPPDDGARPYHGQRPYDVTAVPPGAMPPGPYGEAPQPPYAPPPFARSPRDGLYSGPPPEGPYGPPPPPPYGGAPQGAYGDAPAGPYGAAPQGAEGPPPQGAQGAPGAPQEEWVVVLVSGASMRATATDEAPMLFAFPYGRNLRVVSHYGNWVEVTDPKSAATGWMKDDEVSPIAPPGAGPPQTEALDQRPPEEEGGWFRRRRGGFADMINRALGGGF